MAPNVRESAAFFAVEMREGFVLPIAAFQIPKNCAKAPRFSRPKPLLESPRLV